MTFLDLLKAAQVQNESMLCVGLDPDMAKLPAHLPKNREAVFDFCASIVDFTADLVCSFKPQIAYFAAMGAETELERLVRHIRDVAPQVPVILDAKRGDIGSTAEQYAVEAFERYGADAVTLSPFMGRDSVTPYLKYKDKGVFLLCRTSNPGGDDLQNQRLLDEPQHPRLFEHVAQLADGPWLDGGPVGQIGLVVGATYPEEIRRVRALAPTAPLLIPGVGAQGGDAVATIQAGATDDGLVVVNSSRAVIYAGNGEDFAKAAKRVALETRDVLNAARVAN